MSFSTAVYQGKIVAPDGFLGKEAPKQAPHVWRNE